MERDILADMEALSTQASDADSSTAPAEPPPAVQTPPKDAVLPESNGESVGQESMGQAESDEVEETSVLSLCLSAEADALCPRVTPIHDALQGADCKRNVRNKNSRKRRNIKEKKIVHISWPLTLQTRASSAARVLGCSCVMEVNTGVSGSHAKGSDEKEKISVLTKPCLAPGRAPGLATSPFPLSPEGASLIVNEEIIGGQTSSHKERNKKSKKIAGGPWPLTVQAWASFTGPAKVQTPSAGASLAAGNDVDVRQRSKSQKCETDEKCIVTSCQSTQAGVPTSSVALGQAMSKGAPLTANSERNTGQESSCNRIRTEKSDLTPPWPLTVQAWASFTTTGLVQALLQGNSSAASMVGNVEENRCPQVENSEKETKPVLHLRRGKVQASAPSSATAPQQAPSEEDPSLGTHTSQGELDPEEA